MILAALPSACGSGAQDHSVIRAESESTPAYKKFALRTVSNKAPYLVAHKARLIVARVLLHLRYKYVGLLINFVPKRLNPSVRSSMFDCIFLSWKIVRQWASSQMGG